MPLRLLLLVVAATPPLLQLQVAVALLAAAVRLLLRLQVTVSMLAAAVLRGQHHGGKQRGGRCLVSPAGH